FSRAVIEDSLPNFSSSLLLRCRPYRQIGKESTNLLIQYWAKLLNLIGRDQKFLFYGGVRPKIKFKGQSLEIQPKGTFVLEFPKLNATYYWSNVNCLINNIVVGKLSIEQTGIMEIFAVEDRLKCTLDFKASSSKVPNHVDGFITGKDGKIKLRSFAGVWSHFIASCSTETFENEKFADISAATSQLSSSFGWKLNRGGSFSSMFRNSIDRKYPDESNARDDNHNEQCKQNGYELSYHEENSPSDHKSKEQLKLESKIDAVLNFVSSRPNYYHILWTAKSKHPEFRKFYNLTNFALTLNDMNVDYVQRLPNTDSRFRPDIRYMELGDYENAAYEKKRLEEKQRSTRKNAHGQTYSPR
uniref:Oxysterol-binding protein n=1 Tax=Romanomermis culicivorax TaxID=13658 RepID=A0A915HNH2_ROMCU